MWERRIVREFKYTKACKFLIALLNLNFGFWLIHFSVRRPYDETYLYREIVLEDEANKTGWYSIIFNHVKL